MDQFFQLIGEEALKSLPLALGIWVCMLLAICFAAYKIVGEETDTTTQLLLAAVFVVAILVWIGLGSSIYDDTREFCRDLRNTDGWSEQKCHTIDPGGSPFLSFRASRDGYLPPSG